MHKLNSAVLDRYYLAQITLGRQLLLMLGFNLLLIASAYIKIPLPFSPVPITAQTMAVMACGLFLGPVGGSLTVLAYLLEGSIGLPVFAGGAAGWAVLMGPTGGYLIGFVTSAFVVGYFSEKIARMTYARLVGVLSLGTVAIFLPGLSVLAMYSGTGSVLTLGLFPFLPGAVIKTAFLASGLSLYKRFRK